MRSQYVRKDHLGLADAAFVASSDGEWYYAYYFPFNCRPVNPKTAARFPNEKGFLSMDVPRFRMLGNLYMV